MGEVCAVEGRRIFVLVDAQKNVSDLLLDGEILKNISVNSFVEIRKGFLSIIGKIDGERVEEVPTSGRDGASGFRRTVTITLSGYIDETGRFVGGTRELPLIGNEAYVLTSETEINRAGPNHVITAVTMSLTPNGNVASLEDEQCIEKRRLVENYQQATARFSKQLTILNERLGTSPRDEYDELRRAVDTERVRSEQARLALEQHVADHGC